MESKQIQEYERVVFDLDFYLVDFDLKTLPKGTRASSLLKRVEITIQNAFAADRANNFKQAIVQGKFNSEIEDRYSEFLAQRGREVVERAVSALIDAGRAGRVVHAVTALLCDVFKLAKAEHHHNASPRAAMLARNLFRRHCDMLTWEADILALHFKLPFKRKWLKSTCLAMWANPKSEAAQQSMRLAIETAFDWTNNLAKRQIKPSAQEKKQILVLFYKINGKRSSLRDSQGVTLILDQTYIRKLLDCVDHNSGEPLNPMPEPQQLYSLWCQHARPRRKSKPIDFAEVVRQFFYELKGKISSLVQNKSDHSPVFEQLATAGLTEVGVRNERRLLFKLLPEL